MMKTKLIAIIGGAAALFIGVVLWRMDSFVYGDRLNWVESQGRTQVEALNTAMASELKAVQRTVMSLSPEKLQSGALNWSQLNPYFAVAGLELTGEQIRVSSVFVKEGSEASAWNKDFVKAAIGPLQARRSDMRFYIKPFQDAKRGRYVAVVVLNGNNAIALFGSGEVFQSFVDSQRGGFNSFSVVTLNGLTVAHTVPEYLGTIMREDPVYKWASELGLNHGSQVLQTRAGDMIGLFESIPQTNLLVTASASVKGAMAGRSQIFWQIVLMGAGLLLIGGAGLYYWLERTPVERPSASSPVAEVAVSEPASSVSENVEGGEESLPAVLSAKEEGQNIQEEKLNASVRVASALAHEMAAPLASILGHSQLILANQPQGEVQSTTEAILREARLARGVLDKLLGFAGEEIKEKSLLKVEGPLVKALREYENIFADKGIKVEQEFSETVEIPVHSEALYKAFTQFFQNAVEAMERRSDKKLKVVLRQSQADVAVEIHDTGEGIESENVSKIFDPFFTTRAFQNHMGLGLSAAYGILKEHGAEVKVHSERGQGTSFYISFKPLEENALKAPTAEGQIRDEQDEEFVISANLPTLKPEIKEAEEEVFKQSQTQVAPPLDVNIDDLLSFEGVEAESSDEVPEAQIAQSTDDANLKTESQNEEEVTRVAEVKTPSEDEVQKKLETASVDEIVTTEVFKPQDGLLNLEGLFIEPLGGKTIITSTEPAKEKPAMEEHSDSDKTEVIASPVTAAPKPGPTSEELQTMTEDLEVSLVGLPKSSPQKKDSKLDSYKVEIRRPGKRV